MITVNISNHPTLTSITRTATLRGINWDVDNSKAYVKFKIDHYLGDQLIPELTNYIQTEQDNAMQVPIDINNSTGETMGDYDIFNTRIESGDSFKQIIIDGILLADSIGKINEKMKYITI